MPLQGRAPGHAIGAITLLGTWLDLTQVDLTDEIARAAMLTLPDLKAAGYIIIRMAGRADEWHRVTRECRRQIVGEKRKNGYDIHHHDEAPCAGTSTSAQKG